MKVLLLATLACLMSATKEPLPVRYKEWLSGIYAGAETAVISGNFHTIYLASKIESVTGENSEFRMLMREVKFFKNYTLMSMTFYVRKNGKCQLHTVLADKFPYEICVTISYFDLLNCIEKSETEFIVGTWVLRNSNRHFPHIYSFPPVHGGTARRPIEFNIMIHFVSKTTILFQADFINDLGYLQWLTAALATGTNITEEMWKEYVNLTHNYEIPIENIKNVYEADACPKWER